MQGNDLGTPVEEAYIWWEEVGDLFSIILFVSFEIDNDYHV